MPAPMRMRIPLLQNLRLRLPFDLSGHHFRRATHTSRTTSCSARSPLTQRRIRLISIDPIIPTLSKEVRRRIALTLGIRTISRPYLCILRNDARPRTSTQCQQILRPPRTSFATVAFPRRGPAECRHAVAVHEGDVTPAEVVFGAAFDLRGGFIGGCFGFGDEDGAGLRDAAGCGVFSAGVVAGIAFGAFGAAGAVGFAVFGSPGEAAATEGHFQECAL